MVGEGLSRQEAEVSAVIFAVTNMKGRIRPRCWFISTGPVLRVS